MGHLSPLVDDKRTGLKVSVRTNFSLLVDDKRMELADGLSLLVDDKGRGLKVQSLVRITCWRMRKMGQSLVQVDDLTLKVG
jgi:hypothetical protein